MRACTTPGCGTLVKQGARDGRCSPCQRRRDRDRGSRQERGYDRSHELERARYASYMSAGVTYTCWRCPQPIDPTDWCLGHCDDDRSKHHGPECPTCNYQTASRTGQPCPHPSHTPGGEPLPGT